MAVRKAFLQVVGRGHIRDQDPDYVLGLAALGLVGDNLGRLRTAEADSPVLAVEGSREIAEALAGEVYYNPHHHEEDQEADSDHHGEEEDQEDRRNWVGVVDRGPEDSPAGEEGLRTEDTVVLQNKKVSVCIMKGNWT